MKQELRHKARGQGKGLKKSPRPRTALPRTDSLEAKDRNARGQRHRRKCSPKKRSSKVFFRRSPKKRSSKFFSGDLQNFNDSKKYCCPRAEDRAIFEDLKLRDQGQGLDLRGQGQRHQNVYSRTPPLTNMRYKNNKQNYKATSLESGPLEKFPFIKEKS